MAQLAVPVTEHDHAQGMQDAPVTLVEYGDYQCPDCGVAFQIVQALQKEMGDKLRFVFRNFPLTDLHPHAQKAAEAAEVAGEFGRFWPMHDLLFEHQDALTARDLDRYAEQVGVDTDTFAQDMETHTYAARVQEDFAGGLRSGVQGTPTFYINGVRHDASYDADTLLAALEQAAQKGTV